MLENLRRKSLVKTYHDPIHQVHFEQGLARYRNLAEIDVCTQRLSKELQKMTSKKLQESLFQKAIDTISKESFSFFKLGMIYCPKGTFTMGHIDEKDNPPREETIERSFLLGETEVTQELYEKVIGKNPSVHKNSQNPVEYVSWYEAIVFCNELSKLHGLDECYTKKKNDRDVWYWLCDFSKNGYRLPEEKEWEYAAKTGTENKWAGTDNIAELDKYAWFDGDWQTGTTYPVKSKLPNEWGFYDMSGNVREWCWDKHTPKSKVFSTDRVYRGGAWDNDASYLSSAHRKSYSPGTRIVTLGFRVCRSIVN